MSEVASNQLPEGWEILPVKRLGKAITGNTPPTKDPANYGGDIPFIKPTELVDRPVSFGRKTISVKGTGKARILPKGGVLVSCIGNLGKTAIAKRDIAFNQQINAIIFNEAVIPEYGFYYFQTAKFRKDLESLASATTISIVNKSKFESINVPVAPPEQQKRIVAKIEELFSHIDAGIEALKKAKQLLKQYRQSVLKAAVTGDLTKEWREANKAKFEPASQLLERILKERRQKWEEKQLEQFKAKDKNPKDDKWKEKYKEPGLGADRFFIEIPDEWAVTSIDHLAWDIRYGSSSKTNEEEKGVPVLRMGNIIDGKLDYSNLKYLPIDHDEFPDLLLQDGDLLFNRTNSAELVGKTAVFRDMGKQTSLASYLIRARVLSCVEPDFVAFFINSSCGKNWTKSCVSQNVGQANVNGTKLKALVIPLPDYKEQKEIVRRVEEKILSSDRLLAELDLQLLKAEKNKQSILGSAFTGTLKQDVKNG